MASTLLDRLPRGAAKPTAIAFALAYLSSTFPRIASLLISLLRTRGTLSAAALEIVEILRQGLQINRFPAFCATVVGGSLALREPLNQAIESLDTKIHGGTSLQRTRNNRIAARSLAALTAAIVGFRLLNRPNNQASPSRLQNVSPSDHGRTDAESFVEKSKRSRKSKIPPGLPPLPAQAMASKPPISLNGIPLAGKTIDLTLFAFVRALDVLAQSWSSSRPPPKNKTLHFLSKNSSPILFAASSATIMHAFFYKPSKLPYTYVRWIARIAECDDRLIEALRQIYYGNFIYGKDTGMAPLLGSMAKDYGLSVELGDPAVTVPIPCVLVHHGCGTSCEKHALWRFWRAWRMALGVYVPLQTLVLIRLISGERRKVRVVAALKKAAADAAVSSAFLGSFVALFYYGVCLTRTRLGPRIFDGKTVTPQMWDNGLCVIGGCALCGWSVLWESARRQAELMLFVLPRALGCWVPRRYLKEYRWREEVVFAVSTAIVLTAAQERPERIRGMFGRVLKQIVASSS